MSTKSIQRIDYTEDIKPRLTQGVFTSRTEEWATPNYVFNVLDKEFHFQIDVCATSQNAKCKNYFDKPTDGLKQEWSPYRCWMNPPYGKEIGKWMRKAYEESERGALVVCLVPARTDTKWWHDWAMKAAEIRFVIGRISFGDGSQPAPFPSCLVIFYPELENPYKMNVPTMNSIRFVKTNSSTKASKSSTKKRQKNEKNNSESMNLFPHSS